jgi:hypothetical protein
LWFLGYTTTTNHNLYVYGDTNVYRGSAASFVPLKLKSRPSYDVIIYTGSYS